ncbi:MULTISPECIES: hypothetical protein [unclassified Pseudomonas]|uniref:hypothetical protein n=1 Tax=unclassified Pseudomonas TaxID=196821 RepID=UPI0025D3A051|nr:MULTISPECIES: hypothetical protein [unclassified Pseudomonas]
MIKEIDELMVHWGEQHRQHGLGAGIGSQMGSIMQWKGCAPRGVPGSRIISGGAGMDHASSEIDAAVAKLDRDGKKGQALAKLARYRYVHQVAVREQMREIGIAEGADRTYRNWVARLHQQVLLILTMRSGSNRGYPPAKQQNTHLRVASTRIGAE